MSDFCHVSVFFSLLSFYCGYNLALLLRGWPNGCDSSLLHLHKEPPHVCPPSLISRLHAGMCGISPWSKRYPDCPPTWLSWERQSHDPKWDKLWMREDWLSGGRQSPSQFIWHGCQGNKAGRQEAEKRCELLFVWITEKKPPVLEAQAERC